MKNFFDKKNLQIGLILLIVSMISIVFCYLVYHGENISAFFAKFTNILAPIIDGLIIAFLLIPIVNFIEHRLSYAFLTPKKKKALFQKREAERLRYETEMTEDEKRAYEKKQSHDFKLHRTISIILALLLQP